MSDAAATNTVLVLGLGESGLAMARWCARHGAGVRVWDSRETPPQAAALRAGVPACRRCSGGELAEAQLDGVPRVLKSPGLAPHDERIAPLLAAARARGIAGAGRARPVRRGAGRRCKAERGYAPQLLAITGTNGKTTTTALTALLVERAGQRVVAAGNIGPTLLDTLAARCDRGRRCPRSGCWSCRASSSTASRGFEPDAATVLNLTQDHLDWHGSDGRLRRGQGAHLRPPRADGRQPRRPAGAGDGAAPPAADAPRKAKAPKFQPRRVLRFGLDAPPRPGDFGLVEQRHGLAGARAARWTKASSGARAKRAEIHLQRLMPADALRIRGRHNAANALAALALATAIGCPLAPMLHGLRDYRGEPHRVEPVAVIGGVEAFDDSKGTNVGATVAALDGLGAERRRASWW